MSSSPSFVPSSPSSATTIITSSSSRSPPRRPLISDSRNLFKYFFTPHTPPLPHPPLPTPTSPASFTFGILADIQYAPFPTARGVKHTPPNPPMRRRRAWNETLAKLAYAVSAFNKASVDFVLNLGDNIEGYGKSDVKRNTEDFRLVLNRFKKCRPDVRHVIGNHCRNLPMSFLKAALKLETPFYSFHPAPRWRMVVLHTAEFSSSAPDEMSEHRKVLRQIVEQHGRAPHHFHGAMGKQQLDWLARELDAAEKADEWVIVFSHYPLADGSARPSHVVANTGQVRDVIERKGTPVVLCMAGHDHIGGKLVVPADENRAAVTYVTMPAVLEAPRGQNAYALVTAYDDGAVGIEGVGTVMSSFLPPRNPPVTSTSAVN